MVPKTFLFFLLLLFILLYYSSYSETINLLFHLKGHNYKTAKLKLVNYEFKSLVYWSPKSYQNFTRFGQGFLVMRKTQNFDIFFLVSSNNFRTTKAELVKSLLNESLEDPKTFQNLNDLTKAFSRYAETNLLCTIGATHRQWLRGRP